MPTNVNTNNNSSHTTQKVVVNVTTAPKRARRRKPAEPAVVAPQAVAAPMTNVYYPQQSTSVPPHTPDYFPTASTNRDSYVQSMANNTNAMEQHSNLRGAFDSLNVPAGAVPSQTATGMDISPPPSSSPSPPPVPPHSSVPSSEMVGQSYHASQHAVSIHDSLASTHPDVQVPYQPHSNNAPPVGSESASGRGDNFGGSLHTAVHQPIDAEAMSASSYGHPRGASDSSVGNRPSDGSGGSGGAPPSYNSDLSNEDFQRALDELPQDSPRHYRGRRASK